MIERPEALMIAATLEPVEHGQNFIDVPHMPVLRWFFLPEENDAQLEARIEHLFSHAKPFGANIAGGERVILSPDADAPARVLDGVSDWPYFGIRQSLKRLNGQFDESSLADTFVPYITDTSRKIISENELVNFSALALVIRTQDVHRKRVAFAHPIPQEIE